MTTRHSNHIDGLYDGCVQCYPNDPLTDAERERAERASAVAMVVEVVDGRYPQGERIVRGLASKTDTTEER